MKNLSLLIAIGLFSMCEPVLAQIKAQPDTFVIAHDTSDLAQRLTISVEEFNSLIKSYLNAMQKKDSLKTTNDYIILVRLFNTLEMTKFPSQKQMTGSVDNYVDIYKKFLDTFFPDYFFDFVYQKLHFHSRKGSEGHYSAKYDLGMGPTEFGPVGKRDFYQIE
jgi:hypothetical protein